MSSGLEIRESKIRPGWIGKRLWINLGSLGFQSIHFGVGVEVDEHNNNNNSNDEHDKEYSARRQHREYKSDWLRHMVLSEEDLSSERSGVAVRSIPSLAGVDYLTPGTLTNHVSYVFGPVIQALLETGGYEAGVNLDAASYDWRLPPAALQQRDSYFSNTLETVERLYRQNDNTPVVLLCHSLGCKVGHYFLNYCRTHRGQSWIDRYVHTYMPVGGPHLGAPKALRAVLSGDKMSLDAFLTDAEALSLGRSLGSGPWLFPAQLPPGAPSCLYEKPQGLLEIVVSTPIDISSMMKNRQNWSRTTKFKLSCVFGGTVVTSKDFSSSDSSNGRRGTMVVRFEEHFMFATSVAGPHCNNRHASDELQILLLEPGAAVAKRNKRTWWDTMCCVCCCLLLCPLYVPIRVVGCVVTSVVLLSAEAVTRAIGTATVLAVSKPIRLSETLRPGRGGKGRRVATVTAQLYHGDGKEKMNRGGGLCSGGPESVPVQIQLTWNPSASIQRHLSASLRFSNSASTKDSAVAIARKAAGGDDNNDPSMDGSVRPSVDLLRREGLDNVLFMMERVYNGDRLGPRERSAVEAPPVSRIKAVYGINLPTEVGSVYSVQPGTIYSAVHNFFRLDRSVKLVQNDNDQQRNKGYVLKGGILQETKKCAQIHCVTGETLTCSGDGTVPYWSLQHARTWQSDSCNVQVDEIEKAEHREILADPRFHRILIDYVGGSIHE